MDNFSSGGIGAASVVLVGIIYTLLKHFKCASKCCGKEASLQIDLEQSPSKNTDLLKIKTPTIDK